MKFLTQWLLVFLTVLNPIFSSAALTDFDRQELPVKNWLAPYNSGFESSKAKWTASGGTFAAVTSGTNLLVGKGSATWDGSSSSQTLTSQTITIEKGYYGQNCEAGIVAQVPSGTATHTVQAYDGTNILVSATIVSSATPRLNTVNFPCPQSGTVALRLVTVASDEPLIAVDDAYLGLARNVGGTQLISEWEAWTPSSSWTGGSITYTGFKRRVGTNQEVKFRIALGGAPTGSGLTLNVPSECVVDTAKVTGNNARVPLGNTIIFDSDTSANIYGTVQANNTTSVALNVILTGNASTSPIGQVGASTPITFASGDSIDGYFSVPCVGWAASPVVTQNQQRPPKITRYTSGSGTHTTTPGTTYMEVLVVGGGGGGGSSGTGSLNNGIAGNASTFGTSFISGGAGGGGSASGNTGTGGTASITGSDASGTIVNGSIGGGAAYQNTVATGIQGGQGGGTCIGQGGGGGAYGTAGQAGPTNSGAGGGGGGGTSTTSGFYSGAGGGGGGCVKAIIPAPLASYAYSVGSGGAGGGAGASGYAGGAGAAGYIQVTEYFGYTTAILANSVSTGTVNGEKIERVKLNLSGATTVSITNQSTGWLQSVTASGTVPTITFTPGWFSAEPTCQVTCSTNTSNVFGVGVPNGTTSINIACIDIAGSVRTSNAIAVTCMGPR